MRRTSMLITVVALMLATMALSGGSALAQGQPSCFGSYARSTDEVRDAGPGFFVSAAAQELAEAPGGNPHLAQALQVFKMELCS